MAIDGLSSGTSTSVSKLDTSRKSIADNFDTFLSILTTQLKNQNPLEPLDTNQFTQQLVQFTGVEQQLKTNEFLEAMLAGGQSDAVLMSTLANQAVNLIGKTVVAGSSAAKLENGNASWTYTLGADAPATQVTIRDASGAIVYGGQQALKAGQGNFEWDGKDQSGLSFPDGVYSITIDARTDTGAPVTALTQVRGVVESADMTGDQPVLMVNGARVYLDAVLSVSGTPS